MHERAVFAMPIVVPTVIGLLWLLDQHQASAAPVTCTPEVAVVVDGTGWTPGTPSMFDGLATESTSVTHVDYPAQIAPLPGHVLSYDQSTEIGYRATTAELHRVRASCPGSTVTLYGYSQGARVAGDVLEDSPELADAGVLVSDPRQHGGVESAMPGIPGYATFRGERAPITTPVSTLCIDGDGVCDWAPTSPVDSLAGYFVKHTDYTSEQVVGAVPGDSVLIDAPPAVVVIATDLATDVLLPLLRPTN